MDRLAKLVLKPLAIMKERFSFGLNDNKAFFFFDDPVKPLTLEDVKILDKTAIIPLRGVLTQRLDDGGDISTEDIGNVFQALLDGEQGDLDRIIFDIDSPGGSVAGTSNLSDLIFNNRQEKSGVEIVAVANDMAASAAFWIGSSADKFFLSSITSIVGSVGVISVHVDASEFHKRIGFKITEIVSGDLKNIGSPNQPLEGKAREQIQKQVTTLFKTFQSAITRNRPGMKGNMEEVSKGGVFIGSEAIEKGLVDGVFSIEGAGAAEHNRIKRAFQSFFQTPEGAKSISDIIIKPSGVKASVNDSGTDKGGEMKITLELLKENNPSLLAEIETTAKTAGLEEGKAEGLHIGKEAGIAEGKTAETTRMKGIQEITPKGYESFATPFLFDGKTTPSEFAVAVLKEQKNRGPALETLKVEGQASEVEGTPAPADEVTKEEKAKANAKKIAAGANRR